MCGQVGLSQESGKPFTGRRPEVPMMTQGRSEQRNRRVTKTRVNLFEIKLNPTHMQQFLCNGLIKLESLSEK